MTRKQERARRVALWSVLMVVGLALAATLRFDGAFVASLPLLTALFLGHRIMIAPSGVAILTYHSVGPDTRWLPWGREIAVHPDTLDRHLATLRRLETHLLSTRAFVAARRAGQSIPANAAILHFDDGYRDNWIHAAPLLERHATPATFFVSLDFVEPGESVRGNDDDQGYMNWPEIRALAAGSLFEVEPHGVDHARVVTSDRIVDRLTTANWRRLAWVQWCATPGPKYDWFRHAAPVAIPLGSPVYESALALAAPAAGEGQAAFAARIESDLTRCRETFRTELGRDPQVFCWPENKVGPDGRRVAAALGYVATTGGKRRNTAPEPPEILSRIHMGDRALGFRWMGAEALHLRAAVRLAQGNHYWYLIIAPMNAVRRVVMRVRGLLGHFDPSAVNPLSLSGHCIRHDTSARIMPVRQAGGPMMFRDVNEIATVSARPSERRSDMARRVRFECDMRGVPLPLEYRTPNYARRLKPTVDRAIALIALIAISPLLLVVALIIKLDDRGPVLFVQPRTGYLGRRFQLYKFRTMRTDAEALKEALRIHNIHGADSPDFKLADDPRITRVGKLLRKTSVDELPNLWNIVRGEMSFVGPRPTSFDASTYAMGHLPRLAVRPGLTGLWQVSGRANVGFDERSAMDIAYIRSMSAKRDLGLVLKTVSAVKRGEGAH